MIGLGNNITQFFHCNKQKSKEQLLYMYVCNAKGLASSGARQLQIIIIWYSFFSTSILVLINAHSYTVKVFYADFALNDESVHNCVRLGYWHYTLFSLAVQHLDFHSPLQLLTLVHIQAWSALKTCSQPSCTACSSFFLLLSKRLKVLGPWFFGSFPV